MHQIKTYIAVRDRQLENRLYAIARAAHYAVSPITRDAIINDCRSFEPLFIVEETYRSILRLIEFHNSCLFNFLPTVVVTSDRVTFAPEVSFRFPYKYFVAEKTKVSDLLLDILALFDEFRRTKHQEHLLRLQRAIGEVAIESQNELRTILDHALTGICDLVFAARGSFMLLNEAGNLVVEASTKKNIVGIEVPYSPSSPAWYALKSGEPLFCEDIARDERFAKKGEGYAKDYFLIVPIVCGDRVLGVFNLTDKMVSLLFDRADLVRIRGILRLLVPLIMLRHRGAIIAGK